MRDDQVLLFDLGGVLVETSGQAALRQLLPHLEPAEIVARWLASGALGQFERGRIGPDAFARAFVAEWQLPVEPVGFLPVFSSWVQGFYPGAKRLLRDLRARHTIGCLSNTNATHWAGLTEVSDAFDVCLPSHLTGHMKPDRAAYEHALQKLGVPPRHVYFFDDLLPNVEVARSIGINAFQVQGLAATEAVLRALGMARDAGAGGSGVGPVN